MYNGPFVPQVDIYGATVGKQVSKYIEFNCYTSTSEPLLKSELVRLNIDQFSRLLLINYLPMHNVKVIDNKNFTKLRLKYSPNI